MSTIFLVLFVSSLSPFEMNILLFTREALNDIVFLSPTICPANLSNLFDSSMDCWLSNWLWTMMKQSSKKLITRACDKINVCRLIHMTIKNKTRFTASLTNIIINIPPLPNGRSKSENYLQVLVASFVSIWLLFRISCRNLKFI